MILQLAVDECGNKIIYRVARYQSILALFVCLLLSCAMGGGTTAAVLTPDTAINKDREETAKGVARLPSRFSSRDGPPCYYHDHKYDSLVSPFSIPPCFYLVSPVVSFRPFASTILSLGLFRPCSNYLSFLSMYVSF